MNTRFATPYNHDQGRSFSFIRPNNDESLTQQSDLKDSDINIIMAKYVQTGQLPKINSERPEGGDYTQVGDYREMLDKLKETKAQFDALPAHIRKRFGNDPANMLEFVGNADNKEEAAKLGLLKEPEAPNLHQQTVEQLKKLNENFTNTENDDGTSHTSKRGKK